MYEIERTEYFTKWFLNLKDDEAVTRIARRIVRAQKGNLATGNLSAAKCAKCVLTMGGYRVYYTIRNNKVILLLCGGGKKYQAMDIKKAQEIAEAI